MILQQQQRKEARDSFTVRYLSSIFRIILLEWIHYLGVAFFKLQYSVILNISFILFSLFVSE